MWTKTLKKSLNEKVRYVQIYLRLPMVGLIMGFMYCSSCNTICRADSLKVMLQEITMR